MYLWGNSETGKSSGHAFGGRKRTGIAPSTVLQASRQAPEVATELEYCSLALCTIINKRNSAPKQYSYLSVYSTHVE